MDSHSQYDHSCCAETKGQCGPLENCDEDALLVECLRKSNGRLIVLDEKLSGGLIDGSQIPPLMPDAASEMMTGSVMPKDTYLLAAFILEVSQNGPFDYVQMRITRVFKLTSPQKTIIRQWK